MGAATNTPNIHEPMTALTDLILAALAVYFAVNLGGQYGRTGMRVHIYFSCSFGMLAIGALMGAVSHGIGPHLSGFWASAVWRITLVSIGFAACFMLVASLYHGFSPPRAQMLLWMSLVFLAAYSLWVLRDDRFLWAIVFYVPCMTIVLVVMIRGMAAGGVPGSAFVAAGILVSFAAAIVQRSGITLHRHFNHNDFYHVIQMIGFYYLYRGAMMLEDWAAR